MQMKRNKKLLSFILSMVLIVAMALGMTGCSDKETSTNETATTLSSESETASQTETIENTETEASASLSGNVLGEGKTQFNFTVVDKDGNETAFEIHTDKEMVGDALTELGLISGDEGEYGLYVKTVNDITADYDTDGSYWAFYVNDEYAQTGVDLTPITEGDSYSFKIEK